MIRHPLQTGRFMIGEEQSISTSKTTGECACCLNSRCSGSSLAERTFAFNTLGEFFPRFREASLFHIIRGLLHSSPPVGEMSSLTVAGFSGSVSSSSFPGGSQRRFRVSLGCIPSLRSICHIRPMLPMNENNRVSHSPSPQPSISNLSTLSTAIKKAPHRNARPDERNMQCPNW